MLKKLEVNQMFLVCVASVFFAFFSLSDVHADTPGSLKMNNQVIYEGNVENNNSDANFVISDLFLPKKEEIEEKIKSKQNVVINEIKQEVFLAPENKEIKIEKKVSPYLFQQEKMVGTVGNLSVEENEKKIINIFWTYGLVFFSGVVVLWVGIVLGRRFAYHQTQKRG